MPFPITLGLLAFTTACTNASQHIPYTLPWARGRHPTKLPIILEMAIQPPTNYLVPRGAPESAVDIISSFQFHARDQGCSPKKRSGDA